MATPLQPESLARVGGYAVVRFLSEGGTSWIFEVSDSELFDARLLARSEHAFPIAFPTPPAP